MFLRQTGGLTWLNNRISTVLSVVVSSIKQGFPHQARVSPASSFPLAIRSSVFLNMGSLCVYSLICEALTGNCSNKLHKQLCNLINFNFLSSMIVKDSLERASAFACCVVLQYLTSRSYTLPKILHIVAAWMLW
ncbi:hypothetical protein EMCRGX_G010041 [Ephydatia muelleri]